MTKSIVSGGRARVARLACRIFERGGRGHYVTCQIRPAGHLWGARNAGRRTFPILPREVTDAWVWGAGAVYGATVILAGKGRLWVDGEAREVATGDMVLFEAIKGARIAWEESPDFLEAALTVDAPLGARLSEIGLWPEGTLRRRANVKAARAQFDAILGAIEVESLPAEELLRRVVGLLGWVDGLGTGEAARGGESFARRACALLSERSGPADRIATIARELGYSAPHFRLLFREAVGMSPTKYQLRERMARAMVLLGRDDVKGVAATLGYSDPFVFSRQFKAQVGVAPSVFAARMDG